MSTLTTIKAEINDPETAYKQVNNAWLQLDLAPHERAATLLRPAEPGQQRDNRVGNKFLETECEPDQGPDTGEQGQGAQGQGIQGASSKGYQGERID